MPERLLSQDSISADLASSTLYGLASAYEITEKYGYGLYAVLVKSSIDPTDLANVSWTVVSSRTGKEITYFNPQFSRVDSAVSDSGAFSAFFRVPAHLTTSLHTLSPMGVRYDPTKDDWSIIRGS
ncbi:hypothetical protein BGX23_010570 [Mortierella sp. AD031]|nr:hypothetical protein BGX23_010570 [Mortierella sp. AD031]KAG0211016.1 hypothetical protein BGX33_004571 [Mortierella sp. NVP41]